MEENQLLDPAVVQEDMQVERLPEQAYRVIRRTIMSGRLKPGARLRQRKLAHELGVGISTVREALSRLAADGFVIDEPNRGFRTSVPTFEQMIEYGEVFRLLESRALELSASRISAEELTRMAELLPKTIFRGTRDFREVMQADHEFHSIAFSASGWGFLTDILERTWSLYHSMAPLVHLYSEADLDEWARICRTYNSLILEALKAGDGQKAGDACACLWESDRRLVKRVLDRIERETSPLSPLEIGPR
jgi:DNA-binding GntR family transcriptional regulator